MYLLAERFVFRRWWSGFSYRGVKTYLMAPTSPLSSSTFFYLHIYSPWSTQTWDSEIGTMMWHSGQQKTILIPTWFHQSGRLHTSTRKWFQQGSVSRNSWRKKMNSSTSSKLAMTQELASWHAVSRRLAWAAPAFLSPHQTPLIRRAVLPGHPSATSLLWLEPRLVRAASPSSLPPWTSPGAPCGPTILPVTETRASSVRWCRPGFLGTVRFCTSRA